MNGILVASLFLFSAVYGGAVYERNAAPAPASRRNSYLVSMANVELYETVACVRDIRDKRVCEELSYCLYLFPPRVREIYKECRTAYSGIPWADCTNPATAWIEGEVREQIFACITEKVGKETPEEEMALVGSENCIRGVYLNRCLIKPNRNIYYNPGPQQVFN